MLTNEFHERRSSSSAMPFRNCYIEPAAGMVEFHFLYSPPSRWALLLALLRRDLPDFSPSGFRGLTFSWFAFTLFWFWANWNQIDMVFTALNVVDWLGVWLALWLFVTAILALWEFVRASLLSITAFGAPVFTSRYARVVYATAFGLGAFVTTVLLNQSAPDLVYKAF